MSGPVSILYPYSMASWIRIRIQFEIGSGFRPDPDPNLWVVMYLRLLGGDENTFCISNIIMYIHNGVSRISSYSRQLLLT